MSTRPSCSALLVCVCAVVLSTPTRAQGAVEVHDSTGWGSCYESTVDDDGAQRFAVAWSRRSTRMGVIECAVLQHGRTTASTVHRVTERRDGVVDVRPAITWADDSTLVLAWQRNQGPRSRILARFLTAEVKPLGDEITLGDTTVAAMSPDLRRDADGSVLVVWQQGSRWGAARIVRPVTGDPHQPGAAVASPVSFEMAPAGGIPLPPSPILHGVPTLARGGTDASLLFGAENGLGVWSFVARQLRPEGGVRELLVDSAQAKDMTIIGRAAMLDARHAVFVWKDYRRGNSDIFLRVRAGDDGRLSPALRVNRDTADRWQRLPDVDVWRGGAVVCWEDYRNTDGNQRGDIYSRAFTRRELEALARRGLRAGDGRGQDLRISDGDARLKRKHPRIALAPDGRGLVVWYQESPTGLDVHGRWMSGGREPGAEAFVISGGGR